jgi:hypothetical protein
MCTTGGIWKQLLLTGGTKVAMNEKEGRRVSIAEAVALSQTNPNVEISWRPESNLPEEQQYALVAGEENN